MRTLLVTTALAATLGFSGMANADYGRAAGTPMWLIIVEKDKQSEGDRAKKQREARETQFNELDENRDGTLSRQELSGSGLSNTAQARRFMEDDRDGDNRLNMREYMNAGERRYRERLGQPQSDESGKSASAMGQEKAGKSDDDRMTGDKKAGAKNAARDGDKTAMSETPRDEIEVGDYGVTAGVPHQEAMAADQDKNNRISEREAAYDTAARFRRLDTDNDGNLTYSEVFRPMQNMRFDRWFVLLDENADDKISRDEFVSLGPDTGGDQSGSGQSVGDQSSNTQADSKDAQMSASASDAGKAGTASSANSKDDR